MKPQQLEKWKATREKGMLRYVLVTGVLSYGLAMFIAMTFFVHRDELSVTFIAISAALWTLGGAVFGVAMWFVFEHQFRKANGSASWHVAQGGRYAAAQLKHQASMTVSCAKVKRSKRRFAVLLAATLSLLAAVMGMIASVMAGQAAFLPYNSEGRYFDGVVVHHDGAQFIYGAIALVAWAMAGGMAWFAYRWARHSVSSGRAPEKPRIA